MRRARNSSWKRLARGEEGDGEIVWFMSLVVVMVVVVLSMGLLFDGDEECSGCWKRSGPSASPIIGPSVMWCFNGTSMTASRIRILKMGVEGDDDASLIFMAWYSSFEIEYEACSRDRDW